MEDDAPAFAMTIYGIMDRYRAGVVERLAARQALLAIALALAPESLLDDYAQETLAAFLGAALDRHRSGSAAAGVEVARMIQAVADADWIVLGTFGLKN